MKIISYFLIISLIQIPLFAINFNQLRSNMIENSKELQIKRIEVSVLQEDVNIANSEFYPTFSIGFNQEQSKSLNGPIANTYVGSNNVSSDTLKKSYAYANLHYNIFGFGRTLAKRDAALYNVSAKRQEFCYTRQELEIKLLDIYHNVWKLQEKLNYLKKVMRIRTTIYEYNNRLYNVGNITKVALLDSSLSLSQQYSEFLKSQQEYEENLEELKQLASTKELKIDSLLSLESSLFFEDISFESSVQSKILKERMNQKKEEINLHHKEIFYPNINFYTKYDAYGSDLSKHNQSLDNLRKNSYKFGLVISWELFNGFKSYSLKQKSLLELKRLKVEYDLQKEKFETAQRQLEHSLKYTSQISKSETKSFKFAKQSFLNGKRLQNAGEFSAMEQLNLEAIQLKEALNRNISKEKMTYENIKQFIMYGKKECIVP